VSALAHKAVNVFCLRERAVLRKGQIRVNISIISLDPVIKLLDQSGGSGPLFHDCGTDGFDGE